MMTPSGRMKRKESCDWWIPPTHYSPNHQGENHRTFCELLTSDYGCYSYLFHSDIVCLFVPFTYMFVGTQLELDLKLASFMFFFSKFCSCCFCLFFFSRNFIFLSPIFLFLLLLLLLLLAFGRNFRFIETTTKTKPFYLDNAVPATTVQTHSL